jgi:hypothetical protein
MFIRANQGGTMSSISFVSTRSVAELKSGDQSFKLIALFCCSGLAATIGLLALGVDLSAAWL